MTATSKTVQDVCGQIAAICRRLAVPWAAVAADMNLPSDERAEAAANHGRLLGAASVIETYDGHENVEQRLADQSRRLIQVTALVGYHESIDLIDMSREALLGLHEQFLTDLRQIVAKKAGN